jgi:hypothetical protein
MVGERDVVPRRSRAWLWISVASVCVLLAPAAGIAAGRASGGEALVLVVAQCLTTFLAFLIPQARQLRAERREVTAEEREVDARVDTRLAMNDALEPVVTLLGNLALEPDPIERDAMKAKAVTLVLTTAAALIGPERSRACWFRLDAGPPKTLVPTEHAGRAGSATTTFLEGTPAGEAAIGMVLDDGDLLCEDILESPPQGWDTTKKRDYRTFISVSVIAGDTAYGMLTLDALEPGELTVEDKGLLRLMAGVLAAALSIK